MFWENLSQSKGDAALMNTQLMQMYNILNNNRIIAEEAYVSERAVLGAWCDSFNASESQFPKSAQRILELKQAWQIADSRAREVWALLPLAQREWLKAEHEFNWYSGIQTPLTPNKEEYFYDLWS
jgi:hypothetical protein